MRFSCSKQVPGSIHLTDMTILRQHTHKKKVFKGLKWQSVWIGNCSLIYFDVKPSNGSLESILI